MQHMCPTDQRMNCWKESRDKIVIMETRFYTEKYTTSPLKLMIILKVSHCAW
jgi:hypothetical protein